MKPVIGLIVTSSLASLAFLCLSGCQKGDLTASGTEPRVGVYDIQKVFADIGWKDDLDTKMKSFGDKLSNQLKTAQSTYESQLESEKTSLLKGASTPTAEQKQLLSQIANALTQALRQDQAQDQQVAQQYQLALIRSYREALRPVIANLAEDRNLWIILEKTDNIAYFKISADVTDELVDMAKAHPPIVSDVEVPEVPEALKLNVKIDTNQPATTQSTTAPTTAP